MSTQAMFRPNGDGYDASPAGVLLLAAGAIYGDPTETTPQGIRNAHKMVDGILDAARAGGFKQGDILRTLLARNQTTPRLAAMAQAACAAAGPGAIGDVLDRVRRA